MNLIVSPSVTNQTTTIFQRIAEYANKKYGEKHELTAWKTFIPISGVEYPSNNYVMDIFWPWYCYSWTHEESNIAFEYLMENYAFLTDIEKLFLGSCIQNEYSFYQVKQVQYGQNIVLKDLLSNKEYLVFEHKASMQVLSGDIMFALIAEVHSLNFIAAGSCKIPSKFSREIKAFAKTKDSKNSELSRIDKYFEILDQILIEDSKTIEL